MENEKNKKEEIKCKKHNCLLSWHYGTCFKCEQESKKQIKEAN